MEHYYLWVQFLKVEKIPLNFISCNSFLFSGISRKNVNNNKSFDEFDNKIFLSNFFFFCVENRLIKKMELSLLYKKFFFSLTILKKN